MTFHGRNRLGASRTATIRIFASVILTSIATLGCNNSRYGAAYDRRQPEIRRVAIVPAAIEVQSIHAGGVLEPRPDLVGDVSDRTVATLQEIIRKRGLEPIVVAPAASSEIERPVAERYALLGAISDAIYTHHYEFGKAIEFEYNAGPAGRGLVPEGADAAVFVYLVGVVPTGGRAVLSGTAAAIGFLTGVHIHVSTNETATRLMLVDGKTGEILWFNFLKQETSVTSKGGLKSFVEKAGSYLLKSRN